VGSVLGPDGSSWGGAALGNSLTLHPQPYTRNLKPSTRNPKPEFLNLKPETLNPKL